MVAPRVDARSPFDETIVAADVARAVVRRAHADELCAGHFPGDPLLPGAYLAGLMADVAAVLVRQAEPHARLAALEHCTFARRVVPHEPIVVEARLAGSAAGERWVDAEVRSGGARAARARLRFGAAS